MLPIGGPAGGRIGRVWPLPGLKGIGTGPPAHNHIITAAAAVAPVAVKQPAATCLPSADGTAGQAATCRGQPSTPTSTADRLAAGELSTP